MNRKMIANAAPAQGRRAFVRLSRNGEGHPGEGSA
jgi:hypothetical protein